MTTVEKFLEDNVAGFFNIKNSNKQLKRFVSDENQVQCIKISYKDFPKRLPMLSFLKKLILS